MPKKGCFEDLTGRKFGKLTVSKFVKADERRRRYFECVCDCGEIRIVEASHLRSGHTKSCGCSKNERIKNLNYKLGLSTSKIYYTYRNMLNRCYWDKSSESKNYKDRGIVVCDEWRNKENGFENFVKWSMKNGYSEDMTIDRINVNGNYEPNNCRWTDTITQANNKRNNKYVVVNGEKGTVGNLSRKYNIGYWNLLHYAKGGKNCKYPTLDIKAVQYGE